MQIDAKSLAGLVITAYGTGLDDGRQAAPRPSSVPGADRMTDAARDVIELALREALSAGCNYIGVEHLSAGLARYEKKRQ